MRLAPNDYFYCIGKRKSGNMLFAACIKEDDNEYTEVVEFNSDFDPMVNWNTPIMNKWQPIHDERIPYITLYPDDSYSYSDIKSERVLSHYFDIAIAELKNSHLEEMRNSNNSLKADTDLLKLLLVDIELLIPYESASIFPKPKIHELKLKKEFKTIAKAIKEENVSNDELASMFDNLYKNCNTFIRETEIPARQRLEGIKKDVVYLAGDVADGAKGIMHPVTKYIKNTVDGLREEFPAFDKTAEIVGKAYVKTSENAKNIGENLLDKGVDFADHLITGDWENEVDDEGTPIKTGLLPYMKHRVSQKVNIIGKALTPPLTASTINDSESKTETTNSTDDRTI